MQLKKLLNLEKIIFVFHYLLITSGGIEFNKDWMVCHKVETHNTPSALDPFGGSITGIVGVNRDCLGFEKALNQLQIPMLII